MVRPQQSGAVFVTRGPRQRVYRTRPHIAGRGRRAAQPRRAPGARGGGGAASRHTQGGVSMSAPVDRWSNGERYEAFVGRWSRPTARELLRWLAVPAGARWLDVGCGTGALTQIILAGAAPVRVLGGDRTDGYCALAPGRVADSRASFLVGDAQALPAVDGAFDAPVS